MFTTGAALIYHQQLQGLEVGPDFRAQGKKNWVAISGIDGVRKLTREKSHLKGNLPSSGTRFYIPDDKILEVFRRLGICK